MNNQEQYKPLPANTVGGGIRNNKPTQIIKECARAMLDAWPVSCKDLYDQINCFKPEMISTCAASIRIMQIANIISEHYGIPIVVHLMDDWPKVLYSSSIVLRPFRKRMKRELARLYDHSDMNFAISEGLCTKYESIFHKKHIPLMNPAIIQPYTSSSRGNEGTVKFLYAGSLSLKRDESLLEIAQILKRLNDEQNVYNYCGRNHRNE